MPVTKNTIYTIGYAGFKVPEFIHILKAYQINCVIDVRSEPYSRYFSEYNKENFENQLKNNNMYYRNYAKEFGARQKDRSFYSSEGILDFELFAASRNFQLGVDQIMKGIDMGFTFALMCAEKDPIDCHRSILVSRNFYDLGMEVIHLLPEGKVISQKELEEKLLKKYFPERDQLLLFEQTSSTELLVQAYRKKNIEIGFRFQGEIGSC